ncbi:MAG: hypothetical protein JO326_11455 [Acetobacteraceae bacterium]|nr:hypothetical protein [Acetobacteraceae bacterium]
MTSSGLTTQVSLELHWNAEGVALLASVRGGYELPYDRIRVVMPRAERRKLQLDGPLLTADQAR